MTSRDFPEANLPLAKDQPQYQTLYVNYDPQDPEGKMTACLELSQDEIDYINEHKCIWHTQLTFKHNFQPISMSVYKPEMRNDLPKL